MVPAISRLAYHERAEENALIVDKKPSYMNQLQIIMMQKSIGKSWTEKNHVDR
jgi:hypothetical protein